MTGLVEELEPGESPADLKRPPSLAGARLRRKVPLDALTRKFRNDLKKKIRAIERRTMAELERSGLLAKVERDARERQQQGKQGPIGRGGIPLGPQRELEIERLFETDEMRAVSRLFSDTEDAFEIELQATLRDSYPELFNRGGQAARLELGVRGNFKLKNLAIADALEARANLLAGDIAEDVFDRMKTVIADGFYLEGRGISEVARALRDEFDWLSSSRADRIARTETLSVTEEAQHTVYKASGIHFKRWITTLDGKERDTHFEAHGQLVAIDAPFAVGESFLMYPGDPDGEPGEIINCRCATQPIVTADQAFSDADVWRGDNDPDEFAKSREDLEDELPAIEGPGPSDTEDLEFGDEEPEDEKRLKAEREYERDDRGRFGSGSSGEKPADPREAALRAQLQRGAEIRERLRIAAGRPPEVEPERTPQNLQALPEPVEQAIAAKEARIQELKKEQAFVVNANGEPILTKDGTKTSVRFSDAEVEQMQGGTFTHNHPSSGSFSPDDVILAGTIRANEMRAIGRDGTLYRMQAAPGGEWPSSGRVRAMYMVAKARYIGEGRAAVRAGATPEAAARDVNHRVWSDLAPRMGMVYSRDESRRRAA